MQPMALAGFPGAGVLIHPGQWQAKSPRQAFAVTSAVHGLDRRFTGAIQGQPDHQRFDPSLQHQGTEPQQIGREAGTGQGWQGSDGDPEGIAAGQADAAAADIEGQHRTGTGRCPGHWCQRSMS